MTVDYNEFFEEGKAFVDGEFYGEDINVVSLGDLHVTSGEVVACDPLVNPDRQPLDETVAPGVYPVLVSLLDFGRVAFAMVRFADRPAVRWEYADTYPVDAGMGCFMDADAARLMLARIDDEGQDYSEDLINLFYHGEDDYGLDHTPSDDSDANVILFSSGWGDGGYSSYWGFDANDQIVALVTDFDMVDHEDPDNRLGDPSELDDE